MSKKKKKAKVEFEYKMQPCQGIELIVKLGSTILYNTFCRDKEEAELMLTRFRCGTQTG